MTQFMMTKSTFLIIYLFCDYRIVDLNRFRVCFEFGIFEWYLKVNEKVTRKVLLFKNEVIVCWSMKTFSNVRLFSAGHFRPKKINTISGIKEV